MDNNTYINNSKFMEFIDELATQFTETEFKENTFEERKIYEGSYETHFTNDAQNYFTQKYDEIETMANKIMGLYTDNDKPRKVILEQQELNRKIKSIEVVKEKCYKCHQQIEYTEELPFCPNCLASFQLGTIPYPKRYDTYMFKFCLLNI